MEWYWLAVFLIFLDSVAAQTPTGTTQSTIQTTSSSSAPALYIRLVEGQNSTTYISGRLEVSTDGEKWGTVCDDYFNKSASLVVCRSLGFSDGEAIAESYFGSGTGSVFLDDVECAGTETTLMDCRRNIWKNHDCIHTEDVGVFCYNRIEDVFNMRLVDNSTSSAIGTVFGRVEVKMGKMKWGSVCDDMFNENAAAVVCKYFNYTYGQRFSETDFETTVNRDAAGDRTYLDEVRCQSNDTSLMQCQHNSWLAHDCTWEEDVGTICFNTQVRLRSKGPSVRHAGAVEFWKPGDGWIAVCDKGWTDQDAKVTCRELGYIDGTALQGSALAGEMSEAWGRHPWGSITTVSSYSSVNCTGNETRLADCQKLAVTRNCHYTSSASVICYNTTVDKVNNTIAVRLVDGASSWGRVEIRHRGMWGQICSEDWFDNEATVVCRMQGFKKGKAFAPITEEKLPTWLHYVQCVGNESSIMDCDLVWDRLLAPKPCSPVHVLCYNEEITLSVENAIGHGRVDITYDGVNGTICNENWSDEDAAVVCKMLNYTDGRKKESVTPGTGPVYMSNVNCSGSTSSLFECSNDGWQQSGSYCNDHQNDAGVRCFRNVRLSYGTDQVGVVQIYENNRWNFVCGKGGFNDKAAQIVCKELGFKNGLALPQGVFGYMLKHLTRPNMNCTGTEASILDCPYNTSVTTCFADGISYAAVSCYQTAVQADKYQLEAESLESNEESGRIRVWSYQSLGYVCRTFWGNEEANVLCKQLGQSGGVAYQLYGKYQGPYFLHDVSCFGNESRLEDCKEGPRLCGGHEVPPRYEVAGVLCYKTSAPEVQFRVRGSKYGHLEILINSESGRICADANWSSGNAGVVCRQLGFRDGLPMTYPRSSAQIYMSGVMCNGNEESLFHCTNTGWKRVTNGGECAAEAGAFCFNDVQVTDGPVNGSMAIGTVNMWRNSRWYRVCADTFDQEEADVTCRSLGFPKARILRTARSSYSPTYVTELNCTGNETSLTQCSYKVGTCLYSTGRPRVLCFSDTQPTEEKYYVQNGFNGRVFVEKYGINGTICESNWNDSDASVLCKQLGFAGGVAFGTPREDTYELVWYTNVNCTGSQTFTDCMKSDQITSSCRDSSTSAGALCYRSTGIEIRLADGGKNFGRVEIAYDGAWGTVCDFYWSRYDARALCKQMGYVEGIAYARSRYGGGTGAVYLNEMRCRIDDISLLQCPNSGFNKTEQYCHDHDNDAGVYCFPKVRLEPEADFGALEVWTGYAYGLVPAEGFTNREAKVACRQLGYLDGRSLCCSAFGNIDKFFVMANLKCTGFESSIMDCSYDSVERAYNSTLYASVVCTNVTDDPDAYIVKLDNGTHGRVALRHLNHFGSLCPNGFGNQEASVICREMGLTNNGFAYKRINNNRGKMVREIRWMNNLQCTGNENLLEECPGAQWYNISGCDDTVDAAVFCYRSPGVSRPEFRLQDSSRLQGRVEVKINGTWGSICGINVHDSVATVLCREMGYKAGVAAKPGSMGKSEGPVWINQISCVGNETNLFDCPLTGLGEDDDLCSSHLFDAVIMCLSTVRLNGDINGRTDYGRLDVSLNNVWYSVCDQGLNEAAAEVACRQLGYNKAKRQCCSALGAESEALLTPNISRITCNGNEKELSECQIERDECSSGNYISLLCSLEEKEEKFSMYVESNRNYGMVNVSRFGVVGTVCHENWTDMEAHAVCRDLGFPNGVAMVGMPIPPGMPLIMGHVKCALQNRIGQCQRDEFDSDHGCSQSRLAASFFCSSSKDGIRYQLAPGSLDYSGLAQVNLQGSWGYISRLQFDQEEANVFCRSIGLVSGTVQWRPVSSSLGSSILMSSVKCTGREKALHQCKVELDRSKNRHIGTNFAVSVQCFKGVRIDRGDRVTNGIVKVYSNDRWGMICGDGFDENAADVVCHELGMTNGIPVCCSPYGYNFDSAVISNVKCNGTENSIFDCEYTQRTGRSLCHRQNYASVVCYNGTLSTNHTVKIQSKVGSSGQVSVTYAGVEGRICKENWSNEDAEVVCRMLGYSRGMSYVHYETSSYFHYSGPFWTSEVNCTGNEQTLGECPHIGWGNVKTCKSGNSAGVLCYNREGLFYRYVAGGNQWGRVEVSVDGEWGPMCDRYWDRKEASVMCRYFGFAAGDAYYGAFNNTGTGPVWESNLQCLGTEDDINQCPHEGWQAATSRRCNTPTSHAGIFCYTKVKLSTGIGRSSKHGGVLYNKNNSWYHVCDTGFTDLSARMVCKELGFKDGRSICCSAYGTDGLRSSPLLANMTLRCSASARNVTDCVVEEKCTSGLYASVACTDDPTDPFLDRYNITIDWKGKSGKVKVQHYGVNGRIASKDWDDTDAVVLCKSLGYVDGLAYHYSVAGLLTSARDLGPFWMNSVNCTGIERSLLDCPYLNRTNLGNMKDDHTASALCYNDTGIEYRFGGGGNHYGRVEIRIDGVWGTVCDSSWDDKDARVFCRQQEYNDGTAARRGVYGRGTGAIWLSHIQCTGEEAAFHQCPHRGYSDLVSSSGFGWPFILPCSAHSDDATVFCFKNVRLNQKYDDGQGGVEILINGKHHGVCDTGFDNAAATVVCKSLGMNYTHGIALSGSAFGNISGEITYTSIKCSGNEADVIDCTLSKAGVCSSGLYASAICKEGPFNDTGFDIRLASDGLSRKFHGIIEVKKYGAWGRICMQGWDDNDANVACKMLGYKGGVAYLHIVKNSNAIFLRDFKCTGSETSLNDCPYLTTPDAKECSHDANDAGVVCYKDTGLQYRLFGANASYGRVEIGYDGDWGTVCHWAWSTNNAKIFCQALGQGYVDGLPEIDTISSLPKRYSLLNGVFCNGKESSLLTCLNSGFNSSLLSYLCIGDAYSSCYKSKVEITKMKLVGGTNSSNGRVEVYVEGPNEWGTVCDDYWDHTNAGVVCRSLGWDNGIAINGSAYGKGSGKIWLDNVECFGNETTIAECKSRGIGTHNCNHTEDASVLCYNKTSTIPVTETRSTTATTATKVTAKQSTTATPTTTPTPTPTSTATSTIQRTTPSITTPVPTTQPPTTQPPTTSSSTQATTKTPSTVPPTTPKPSTGTTPPKEETSTVGVAGTTAATKAADTTVVAVVVPIVLLLLIIVIIAVVFWRVRRHSKPHIAHERFHDDIIEQTHDGSIAMRNQLYDMNMANGEAVDPLGDSTKYMAEDAEISIEGNGYAHFSKTPSEPVDEAGGFSNPLYAVMKDPAVIDSGEIKLDADLNDSKT